MSDALHRAIERLTAPLRRRIMNMICRGILDALTDEAGGHQLIKGTLLDGEVMVDGEFIGHYGFTSRPPGGSEYLVAFWGGDRSHPIVIAINDPATRKDDLADGDAAMYTPAGNFIQLKQLDGEILLSVPEGLGKIRLEADKIELHARAEFKFDVDGNGEHWFPADIETYTIGATSHAHAISPAEIP